MNKRLLALAAIGVLAAPAMGGLSVDIVRGESAPNLGWKPPKSRHRQSWRAKRDPSRLQLRGWPKPPCEAPRGYFWHQAVLGRMLFYLLKIPADAVLR